MRVVATTNRVVPQSPIEVPANAILVFCLAALLSSQLRHATDKYWIQPGVIWKGLLSLALPDPIFVRGVA